MAVDCLFLRLRRANCFELSTVFYMTCFKSLRRNELFAILIANIYADVNKNNRLFGGPQVDARREKEEWTPKIKMATDGGGELELHKWKNDLLAMRELRLSLTFVANIRMCINAI